MSNTEHLILVDGSSYLFRAFHALPPLVNSKRQPTGAVKGVISMVRKLAREYPDSRLAVVFDAKGKTFRNDLYSEYKANRPPMPDELRSQIQPIHDIITAMGIPLIVIPQVEADDVIGTLAQQACAAGIDTLVSTGDKDLAQLVNAHVTLINTMSNEVLDEPGVLQKFGIGPAAIIDYLALIGDKSDNIPGVPGVGPKTAVKWLQEYENLKGIIANSASIKGKVGERLRENLEQLELSYLLATIKLDVELEINLANLKATDPQHEALHQLFSQLEFKSWIQELENRGISSSPDDDSAIPAVVSSGESTSPLSNTSPMTAVSPAAISYRCITSDGEFDALLSEMENRNLFSIVLELNNAHFMDAEIIGIAIATESGVASYIPVGHQYEECPPQLDAALVLEKLKPLLENGAITKAVHDSKLLAHVLENYGIVLEPFKFDALLASYVLNSVASKHQLGDIVKRYLEKDLTTIDDKLGKGKKKLQLRQLAIEEVLQCSCEKADYIFRLSSVLPVELAQQGNLAGLYKYYELPLVPVLQRMERNGITIDSQALQQQSQQLGEKISALTEQAYELAGEEFNLGSPKQLQAIFYEKLNLPVRKKTATGQPSTAEPVLQELALDYELPRIILQHRSLSKLKSTYTDKLPLEVNKHTGRIHSSFQQAVAATGRLSSTEPNLQNIPIRTAEGRRIRQAFIPDKGYILLAADYSQVELRIMAHLSQDAGLLSAFSAAEDVHRATAADVFSVPADQVTAEQRRNAKAINFGLIYGMSAFGLANQLGISRGDAQSYVDRYFEKYPGVRSYMDETRALADEKGYVETLFGRRLYLPDIHAGNGMLRKAAQRTAINAPMQGTAADIIKQSMIDIQNWLNACDLDARLLLQVHDELVFEVKPEDAPQLAEGVRFRMVSAASLDVPLVVDIGVGKNWDEAH